MCCCFFRYKIAKIGGSHDWVSRTVLSACDFFGLSVGFWYMMLAPLVAAVSNPDQRRIPLIVVLSLFESARLKFDIRFYLVAILFVIFDLEVAFLFPWAVGFQHIGSLGFLVNDAVSFILTIGFLYEWKRGPWSGNKSLQKTSTITLTSTRRYHSSWE